MPVRLHREEEARAHRRAVKQHGASPAYAMLAPNVRARQPQIMAQEVAQQEAWVVQLVRVGLVVYLEGDLVGHLFPFAPSELCVCWGDLILYAARRGDVGRSIEDFQGDQVA